MLTNLCLFVNVKVYKMRNKHLLLLKKIDERTKPLRAIKNIVPHSGWIYSVRTSLNITLEQLGKMLNISRQSVSGLEKREVLGTITLNSLKEVANVLGLQLVYGFVPKNGTFEDLVEKKAKQIARK